MFYDKRPIIRKSSCDGKEAQNLSRKMEKRSIRQENKKKHNDQLPDRLIATFGTISTTIQKHGNETESDSEYVSTVETSNTVTTDYNATITSNCPPPLQDLLRSEGKTSFSTNQSNTSKSTVTTRSYQPDLRTTVTHTTITFSEPDTTNSTVPTGTSSKVCSTNTETKPGKPPQMVVPNITVPVLSPLLLRINPLQSAVVAHISDSKVCTLIKEVEIWKAEEPHSAHYRLVTSAEVPVQCTFTMPSFVAYVASIQHIVMSPIVTITAFCLPTKQKTKRQEISRKIARAHLMLPPQGPLQAEKLRPLWETITFTIAYGKHVAIEYRIPKLSVTKIIHSWTASKAHQIILTTVEKSDPQIVRRVRLEQNPLFERMPPYCDVAEVDLHITEQSRNVASTGEERPTEQHTYMDHKLIQRWKNTVHIENRRTQID